jgi:hypothetical protein
MTPTLFPTPSVPHRPELIILVVCSSGEDAFLFLASLPTTFDGSGRGFHPAAHSTILDIGGGDMTWTGPSSADEVAVPDVVGLTVPAARQVALKAGVVIAEDPDGPPLGALTWPGVWVVTAQRPAPGSVLRRLGSVVVEFRERSGGDAAGDREPRRPLPPLDVLGAQQDLTRNTDQPG